MLRFGIISESDPAKGLARVKFGEDGIVTKWLPVLMQKTLQDQHAHSLDVNEHVVCLMDAHAEEGVILGAIYSTATAPPSDLQSADVAGAVFSDGSKVSFDRSSSTLLVEVAEAGTVTVKVGTAEHTITANGHTIKNTMSLKGWLESLCDALLAETHPTGTGPSGPPINAASYTAAKANLANIFEG